jgi:hypothetical protein
MMLLLMNLKAEFLKYIWTVFINLGSISGLLKNKQWVCLGLRLVFSMFTVLVSKFVRGIEAVILVLSNVFMILMFGFSASLLQWIIIWLL